MVVGVVFNPFQNELFSARRGDGATFNGKDLSSLPKSTALIDATVAVGFPSEVQLEFNFILS